MRITLIGYRGCGKSSVAPALARALDWPWVDSDNVIEESAGCSIRQLFETEGEAAFRVRESRVLDELLQRDPLIVAAGGGAVLAPANRQRMTSAGPVIWLRASADVLASRIAADANSQLRRPSLTGVAAADEVATVLAVREPIYHSVATLIVDAERLLPGEIAEVIMDKLELTRKKESTS